MASLVLDQFCSPGLQSVDDQQGLLLDALTELRTALLNGTECRTVRGMLSRVADLMRMHLETENRMLARHGFPGAVSVRAEQQRLLGRLEQFDIRLEQRQMAAVYELVEYLRKWFTTRTMISGRPQSVRLQSNGVH